jgi:uncharacterized membrane protein (UPF0127 family)
VNDRDPLLDLPEGLPPRLREYIEPLSTEKGRNILNYVVGGLAFLAFLAFLSAGAGTPADPVLGALTTTTTLPPPKPSRIPGFYEIHMAVVQFGGFASSSRHFCGVHADTQDQKVKGLQGRTDLANYDAMVFSFPEDTQQPFTGRGTRMAIEAGFFDGEGRYIGVTKIEPCRVRRCPSYTAPGNVKYRFVLETQEGGLARLGITPGATVSIGGGCI